jgi:uncharacterized protein (DUF2267 family)
MSNRPYDAQYEPRPREQAFEEQQRHQQLLLQLARAGLGGAERVQACLVAVLGLLERRITGPEARDLNQELPWALADVLRPFELHPRQRPERFDRDTYLDRVAAELGVGADEAERIARTVLGTVRAFLSEKEASDVQGQLPPDLQALWAPPA